MTGEKRYSHTICLPNNSHPRPLIGPLNAEPMAFCLGYAQRSIRFLVIVAFLQNSCYGGHTVIGTNIHYLQRKASQMCLWANASTP